ncbi:MAG: histone deacetylase family protein [Alphaproteobacteria bacterium]|nr:histone deacetylase family protein [Alphaproteobacteria bacterium]
MTTRYFFHPVCIEHEPSKQHPESSDRLRTIAHVLLDDEFDALDRQTPFEASRAQIMRAHPKSYVDRVFATIPEEGYAHIDADTIVSPKSGEAALRAAGALIGAVDAVMTGEVDSAFCAIRPPGHHAEAERGMGFCLFNNVVIGAEHARAAHGAERVAVVDFDVHHGNGTQAMFWDDADMFYASTHQWPLYPGTGDKSETGAHGNIVNAPLWVGAGSNDFRTAMREVVLPALEDFAPDLVMISAGFDAHRRDPLAQLELETEDFVWATDALRKVAEKKCDGRLISTLEGGYDLQALGESAAAHVRVLMG